MNLPTLLLLFLILGENNDLTISFQINMPSSSKEQSSDSESSKSSSSVINTVECNSFDVRNKPSK